MVAKDALVEQEGIGEDLPFTVFGWCGSTLTVVAQLDSSLMKIEPDDRLIRVSFCSSMFRMGWGVDSITFMAEAYCSTDPEKTKNEQLDFLFANNHDYVSECLTFTHVDENGPSLVLLPYKVGFGRKIQWEAPIRQSEAKGLRDAAYPAAIADALTLEVHERPPDLDKYFAFLVEGLMSKGFHIDLIAENDF